MGAVGRPGRLPFLRAAAERRIIGARLLAPQTDEVPPFPLEQTVAALAADPPHWPASTTDLRRVRLALRFSSAGLLRLLGGTAELSVEILDYPGEWLLDLPLLQQSYGDWSRATLALARRGVRAPLARDWLDFVARHPTDRTGDQQTALQAHQLYRGYLAACREREQLSLLQPGRFLNPGQITDFSVLQNELKGKSDKIAMVAFDLLYLNGYDLRTLPLVERKTLLKKLIAKTRFAMPHASSPDLVR